MGYKTQFAIPVTLILLPLMTGPIAAPLAAREVFSAEFIRAELQRAKTGPDHRVTIEVNAPIELVFDALLLRLDEFSSEVKSIRFAPSGTKPEVIGVGSERTTVLANDKLLIQRLLEFEPPSTFAYFTDMEKSDASVPIDYSIGQYQLTQLEDGRVQAQVSVVFKPSSRLTGFIVRRALKNSLNREFEEAEKFLNR